MSKTRWTPINAKDRLDIAEKKQEIMSKTRWTPINVKDRLDIAEKKQEIMSKTRWPPINAKDRLDIVEKKQGIMSKTKKGEYMPNNNIEAEIKNMVSEKPYKIIISNIADKAYEYRKIEILQTVVKGEVCYQIAKYTQKQVFQENVDEQQLESEIMAIFPEKMCQLNSFTEKAEHSYKVTKKGKLLYNKKINSERMCKPCIDKENISHNRQKNYILKEGEIIPPLVDMGIFTKEGKVVRTMYDKFKQINRFVEIVDDVIKTHDRQDINIIDFGCGKSYLTFILYYYLVNIKHINAHIIGLDLKEDVIKKCNEAANRYGYENLVFELGDINGYKSDRPVDMVVTLHACDTATDYALYNAVSWNARYILSVPCCQHELNQSVNCDVLKPIMDYGILKERFSAIATDAIRGNMLTYKGYKTQIMEFVDMAHSPKNLLIRAVKSNISKDKRERALEEVERMNESLGTDTTLYRLFMD